MKIDEHLTAMRPFIAQRDWDGLEKGYEALCGELAGPERAERIAALDFASYQRDLQKSFAEAASRFKKSDAVALYFEYDLDNGWDGTFFLCQQYNPESAQDEDWACEWVDEVVGPGFEEASDAYLEHGFDRTPDAVGSTLFLVARTVAAYGRCSDSVALDAMAICIAFHDQSAITRVRERAA